MADCPQFQLMPQMVPIYRPQPPPTPFPLPGQPMFPMPPHFGYPPIAWSPMHHYSPTPQQTYHVDEDNEHNNHGQLAYCNASVDDSPHDSQHTLQRSHRQTYSRSVSNKSDTRHEEFRKYLEEVGIISTFTNIIAEIYQDPLRPSDPLGYIRDKLSCSRQEFLELTNLRHWCEKYQNKNMRLEKELKDVINRLRKHEPYTSDEENLSDSDCTSEESINGLNEGIENLGYENVQQNIQ